MTMHLKNNGGVAVGDLSMLAAWEQALIHDLRLWCQGPDGRAQVWNRFALTLPRGTAGAHIHVFEDLIATLSTYARRTLVRHHVECACLGADEAVFLHIVRAASAGDIHDAAMVAALVVLPAHAERVALMAAQVGVATRHISDVATPVADEAGDRPRTPLH